MIEPRIRTIAPATASTPPGHERPADLYDAWLFAAADATLALDEWRSAIAGERADAYAGYVAALDREEQAALRLRLRLAAA